MTPPGSDARPGGHEETLLDKLSSRDELLAEIFWAIEGLREEVGSVDLSGGDTVKPADGPKLNNLPKNTACEALQDIKNGNTGLARVNYRGTDYIIEVEARSNIEKNTVIEIIDDGNLAVYRGDVPGSIDVSFNQNISSIRDITQNAADDTNPANKNVAMLYLGINRDEFDFYYDLNDTVDDMKVEVSWDGEKWRPHDSISITSSNQEDIVQDDTKYRYVRVFAGTSFGDTDVGLIELLSKGD